MPARPASALAIALAPAPAAPAELPAPAPRGRRGWLVVGLVLAAAATAAVFFTDDPLYLRVALLAVCWAFVVAAFLAGDRRADRLAAAGREAELRHAYALELEREVSARHAYEVQLESRLRREAEDAMRTELTQLRGELAGLGTLRDEVAAIGQLRTELAALTELRGELAGLGELRTDLGRMRSELTEQLSGELLVERMVMRAQSVRGPAQPTGEPSDARTLEGVPAWEAPEGWEVDRWAETHVVPAEPRAAAPDLWPAAADGPEVHVSRADPPAVPTVSSADVTQARPETRVAADEPAPRLVGGPPPVPPPAPPRVVPPSPLEWLGERSLVDEHGRPTGELPVAVPEEPRRHRRRAPEPADDGLLDRPASPLPVPAYEPPSLPPVPADEPPALPPLSSGTSSAAPADPAPSRYDSSAYDEMLFGTSVLRPSTDVPADEPGPGGQPWSPAAPGGSSFGARDHDPAGYRDGPAAPREPSGHARLEQILAESGVEAPSGSRSRRRRYRDEDGGTGEDDVLARLLGR